MAEIKTPEEYRQVYAHLMSTGALTFQGEAAQDIENFRIIDRRPHPNPDPDGPPNQKIDIDITPSRAVMEQALDAAQAANTLEHQREVQRDTAQAALQGNLITAVLQNIVDDQNEITGDNTEGAADLITVNGLLVLTLANIQPILRRLIGRQIKQNQRQKRILERQEIQVKIASRG